MRPSAPHPVTAPKVPPRFESWNSILCSTHNKDMSNLVFISVWYIRPKSSRTPGECSGNALNLYLNKVQRDEGIWGNGGVTPHILTSVLDAGVWPSSCFSLPVWTFRRREKSLDPPWKAWCPVQGLLPSSQYFDRGHPVVLVTNNSLYIIKPSNVTSNIYFIINEWATSFGH